MQVYSQTLYQYVILCLLYSQFIQSLIRCIVVDGGRVLDMLYSIFTDVGNELALKIATRSKFNLMVSIQVCYIKKDF